MSWRRRAMTYRVFSNLPFGDRVFDVVRTIGGGTRRFDLRRRWHAIEETAAALRVGGKSVAGKRLAEIGAGWHPLLATIFHALGADRIRMTDILPHLKQRFVEETIEHVITNSAAIAALLDTAEEPLRRRWLRLRPGRHPWQRVWRDHGIDYVAPFQFSCSDWPAESVDMIFSNSCLGYIPVSILEPIFAESARLLNRGGWILHDIGVYDDFSVADASVSPLNFLMYSDDEWERVGNSKLHYQNRCRPNFYVDLAARTGFEVLVAERYRHHLRPEILDRTRLHSSFRDLPDDELVCASVVILAEKRVEASAP